MIGRRIHSRIFAAGKKQRDMAVGASLLSKRSLLSGLGLWWSSFKSPGCQLRQLRGWRSQSGRPNPCFPRWRRWSTVRRSGPLGGGTARLPNGRCDASLVERSVWRIHRVVAVDFPHELNKGPVFGDWSGSELPIEGLHYRLRAWVGLSLEGDWDVRWGTRPIATQFAQEWPVAPRVGGTVRRLLEDSTLVLRFLA